MRCDAITFGLVGVTIGHHVNAQISFTRLVYFRHMKDSQLQCFMKVKFLNIEHVPLESPFEF